MSSRGARRQRRTQQESGARFQGRPPRATRPYAAEGNRRARKIVRGVRAEASRHHPRVTEQHHLAALVFVVLLAWEHWRPRR